MVIQRFYRIRTICFGMLKIEYLLCFGIMNPSRGFFDTVENIMEVASV